MAPVLSLKEAISSLQRGGVIAYPTEAVFGIGGQATNQQVVRRIFDLKQRPKAQGFIIVVSDWQMIEGWWDAIPEDCLQEVQAYWPGPRTYIFPAGPLAPTWLVRTLDQSIAIRMSAHPVIRDLCVACGPLISTSANVRGDTPCRSAEEVQNKMGGLLDGVLPGKVDLTAKPSQMKEAVSGKIIRG